MRRVYEKQGKKRTNRNKRERRRHTISDHFQQSTRGRAHTHAHNIRVYKYEYVMCCVELQHDNVLHIRRSCMGDIIIIRTRTLQCHAHIVTAASSTSAVYLNASYLPPFTLPTAKTNAIDSSFVLFFFRFYLPRLKSLEDMKAHNIITHNSTSIVVTFLCCAVTVSIIRKLCMKTLHYCAQW